MWAKIIIQCSTSSNVGLPICIHTPHMHKRLFQYLHFSWLHSKLCSDVLPFHCIKRQENCNPVYNFHSLKHILVISINPCVMKRSYHLQWWWYWQGTVMLHHLICLLFCKDEFIWTSQLGIHKISSAGRWKFAQSTNGNYIFFWNLIPTHDKA